MSGVIKIEIWETEDDLKLMLKSNSSPRIKERIQALYWLKTNQVHTTLDIAQLLGKHRTTVSRWLSVYRTRGIDSLLTLKKSTGRPSKISLSVRESLQSELDDPEGFSSYKEIQFWLQLFHDIQMSYSSVHQLVRYRLGAKLKVPRPVHLKQKTGAVEEFKKAHRPR